jgi:hypothetical protein
MDVLKTNIVWQERDPMFHYRSQFPLMMNKTAIDKLQNFMFIMEIWDHVSPSRQEFIGLVKIPLTSFCISMRTFDDQVLSLNFLAD